MLSIIVHSSVALQVLDELAQVIRIDLISFECIRSPIHELDHVHFGGIRSYALLLHLYFVLFDSLHLISQLLSVVRQNLLSVLFGLLRVASQNRIKNLLAALLTVVDSKSDFHIFVRLQITMRQLLKEVKDDVLITVWIFIHRLCHFLLSLLATFHEFEEFIELNVHIIINRCYHFFDLLAGVNKSKCDEWVFKFIDADSLRTIFIKIIEAVIENCHLLLVKVDVLGLAVLA